MRYLAASLRFKIPSEQRCLAGTVPAVRVLISFLSHFAVTTKHCVISGDNKQQGARKMSGSGKCVEQNKQRNIDTATCIPQANELLLLVSVFTFTIVITLLKRARIPAVTQTHTYTPSCYRLLSAVTLTTGKARVVFGADCCFHTN